ncbi:MAG: M28 family peptidase [bacterium]|jgi:hypothetical protein
MIRNCLLIVSICIALAEAAAAPALASANFDPNEYMEYVSFLASDELEGRLSGTQGCYDAAAYLASVYYNFAERPGDDWFQQFEFTSGVELAEGNMFEWLVHGQSMPLTLEKDWMPVFFSPSAEVKGGPVFVGYGISAAADENYDDYADLDVEGKVVIVLRHEPQTEDPAHFGGKRPTAYSDLRQKAYVAKRNGAVGMIVTTGPLGKDAENEDRLMQLSRADVYGDSGIPIAYVRREKIEEVMAMFGGDLAAMQKQMDEELKPAMLDMSYLDAHFKTSLNKIKTKTENVIAILPGRELPDEYIIVGAHYDHLGHGEAGASSLTREEFEATPFEERIHHGADDNASGTAGTLMLGEYFYHRADNRRTLVFINFSAEELGALGSLHYAANPLFPLDKTVAMFNFDMIGRVRDNVITLQGIGTAAEWTEILDGAAHGSPLTVKRFDDGVGGSDYTSFYAKGIPVLNFFSGLHDDYHRPSDTADKINAEGACEVLEIAAAAIDAVDKRDAPLTFQKTKAPETTGGGVDTGTGFSVYFGSIPDYSYDKSDGVMLQGVREGSPAAEAGLLAGDLLVEFGGAAITNIYDLTYALQDHKPGDVVKVVVIRGGQRIELTATLKAR